MISSVPDILTFPTTSYDMLLLATDGLFEAFTPQEIHQKFVGLSRDKWNSFATELSEEAVENSSDNITVVTVLL